MSLNRVMLIGNICNDIEMKTTQSGQNVVSVSLATNERYKDKAGNQVDKSEFHRLVLWGKQAELINSYCRKGSKIYVEGKMQTREWQNKDGAKQFTTEVVCHQIQFLDSKPKEPQPSYGNPEPQQGMGQRPGEDEIPF